jgi:hypothetical protein
MDVLDPLGTVDAIAPHTTSFSSNIYLLKKESKSFTRGQLIKMEKELSPQDDEKLWFGVGKEIDTENAKFSFSDSCLARIYGFSLSFFNGQAGLVEDETEVALGRVFVVNENFECGEKVGEFNGFEVWTRFGKDTGCKEEEEGLWMIMQEQFGKSNELAFYWFLRTGKFYGEAEYTPAGQEEIDALESLDIPSLLKPKQIN